MSSDHSPDASDTGGPSGAADADDPLAPHAAAIMAHMNADHADAMVSMARAFTDAHDATAASMTAIDSGAFSLTVTTGGGQRSVRIAFDGSVADTGGARAALVAMVKAARRKLGD